MRGVLEGVRVLDFGRYVAGPLCATVLADFGADVIRVERVGGSEDRAIVPVAPDGPGAIFLQLNRNKRSLTLDTRKAEALPILDRLIASADAIVVNVPSDALASMRLDYARARSIRPDIVHCNATSFGKEGPWSQRGGFDSIGQAMSGAAYLSGEPGRPIRQPITWVDHATGLYAAIGVLLALFERQRSGRGQEVSANLVGSATSFAATFLIEQLLTGIGRTAIGNRSFVNGPTDMFACADGWIVTQVVGDALFRRWTRLIDEPQWLEDPRFSNDMLRGENGAILSERMSRWCAARTVETAIEQLANAGVPAGPVLSPQQAAEHPQIQAMDLMTRTSYPGLGQLVPVVKLPIGLSETPSEVRTAPPTVGEHNHEILTSLGFTPAQIRRFEGENVI